MCLKWWKWESIILNTIYIWYVCLQDLEVNSTPVHVLYWESVVSFVLKQYWSLNMSLVLELSTSLLHDIV